jgi:hypothetical protein
VLTSNFLPATFCLQHGNGMLHSCDNRRVEREAKNDVLRGISVVLLPTSEGFDNQMAPTRCRFSNNHLRNYTDFEPTSHSTDFNAARSSHKRSL